MNRSSRFPVLPRAVAFVSSLSAVVALASPAKAASLDDKLAEQWKRYAVARKQITEVTGRAGKVIDRGSWEALLAPAAGLELNDADLQALRARQAERAAAGKLVDDELSHGLDLDRVRGEGRAAELCRTLPKGGMLHVHPWGTLDRETVAKILDFTNATVRPSKLHELLGDPNGDQYLTPGSLDFLSAYADLTPYRDLGEADQARLQDLFFLPEGTTYDFRNFTGTFTFISQLVFSNKEKDPAPLMWDALFARARANGLRYLEISGNAPRPAGLAQLTDWQNHYFAQYGIMGYQLAAFARSNDPEKNRAAMRDLLALSPSPVLLGINLVADESTHPMLESGQTIYAPLLAARADGKSALRATVHAGELGDDRNPRDAMILGSERLGHGVRLSQDPVALQYAVENGIAMESNLTSNLRLRAYPDLKSHPFLANLRMGLPVSLSTDDEGIFAIDLDHECVAAVEGTDLDWYELKELALNALATSFAPDDVKAKLRADLVSDLALFEKTWK